MREMPQSWCLCGTNLCSTMVVTPKDVDPSERKHLRLKSMQLAQSPLPTGPVWTSNCPSLFHKLIGPWICQENLKASVFSPGRIPDKTMGIDTQQLTWSKTVPTLTKPHVFMQRLNLMQYLVPKFHAAKAAHLDFDVISEINKMWINQLMMPDFFITWTGRTDQHLQLLVLGSGPYSTLCYKLHSRDEFWVPSQKDYGIFCSLCFGPCIASRVLGFTVQKPPLHWALLPPLHWPLWPCKM